MASPERPPLTITFPPPLFLRFRFIFHALGKYLKRNHVKLMFPRFFFAVSFNFPGSWQVPEEEHVQRVGAQAAAVHVRRRGEALPGQGQHRVRGLWPQRQGSHAGQFS